MPHVPARERRRQIVEAAIVVMREAGLEGASIRRIAKQAGAPLASVHYTFEDKEALFAAVYRHWVDLMTEQLSGQVAEGRGLEACARGLMTGFLDWVVGDRTLGIAQFELMLWAARTPSASEFAASIYEGYRDVCRVALTRATGEELDPAHLEPLIELLVAALDGVVIRFLVDRDEQTARRTIDRFIALALGRTEEAMPG